MAKEVSLFGRRLGEEESGVVLPPLRGEEEEVSGARRGRFQGEDVLRGELVYRREGRAMM